MAPTIADTDLILTHATATGATAHVRVGSRVASLAAILDAAVQPDAALAADYAAIVAEIAPRVYVAVRWDWDGSPGGSCTWPVLVVTDGCGGSEIARRRQVTRGEFRGRVVPAADKRAAELAVLRWAVRAGLGAAQHWANGCRTVADAAA